MRISDWSSDVCSSDLGGLAALAQQRDLVDGERIRLVPGGGIDAHAQRVEGHLLGAGQTLGQAVLLVLVHHEADGAAVHAVDRHAAVDEAVQGLQHEHRSEEHTSELQSLMRSSYAVFCLKKKKHTQLL